MDYELLSVAVVQQTMCLRQDQIQGKMNDEEIKTDG